MLRITDLCIDFPDQKGGWNRAVDHLSLDIGRGESVGLVGESGSGKSATALAILRLLPPSTRISGSILLEDACGATTDILNLPPKALNAVRGRRVSMIFQEPMSALNPVMRCGLQIAEAIRHHLRLDTAAARDKTMHLLERVRLPDPERAFRAYPHELSGGQIQRIMIAMALSCQPELLLADEPTTALDVTVQKGILDLLEDIKASEGLSMLLISHDLGVVQRITNRVAVLFRGQLQETGSTQQVLHHPSQPYTKGLVACRPRLDRRYERMPTLEDYLQDPDYAPRYAPPRTVTPNAEAPLLSVSGLRVHFPAEKNFWGNTTKWVKAVDQVSLHIAPGECLGLAGASGCGKTTLGRAIARLTPAQGGQILFKGMSWLDLDERTLRQNRKHIQVVFQDPYASLNPRMTVGEAIGEPMMVHGLARSKEDVRNQVVALLEQVGLEADHYTRLPHAFSGGQRQRIGIARALALRPDLLICDEVVSALDVSVQATILNLLADLRTQLGLSMLFISHDLAVIHQLCDRLLIMKSGRLEAGGLPDELFAAPPTPYVQELLDAVL
jgi:peptide/nickel transport system ATP-binding protein